MADLGTSVYQSPEAYLATIISRVQQLGSKLTDFSVGSAGRTLYESLCASLSQQSAVVEQLRQDSYLATATGDALDRKGANSQVARNPAVAAIGAVTITRAAGGGAVTIPAGWGPLSTVPTSGQLPVTVLTTADAVFAAGATSVTVAAAARDGGAAGNLPAATPLLAINAVSGFDSQTGFAVSGAPFTNGVDAETDDAYRARIPITVQGRVLGRKMAFLAAALAVPGVLSANVLQPTDARGDGTFLPVNTIEVYWEGPTGVAAGVTSAIASATVSGQSASAIAATAERLVAQLTVFCNAGVDTTALGLQVSQVIQSVCNAVAVGGIVRQSAVINAVHALPNVIAVSMPLTNLRKFTDAPGVAGDVTMLPTRYPTLAAADTMVAVTALS